MSDLTQKALAKQDPVTAMIDNMKSSIARAVPQHIGAERMARVLMTEIRKNPKLTECMATPDGKASLLGSLMLSAQLGLEPGPLGHSYLVPFGGKVEFLIGYRGYLDLARRSGNVKTVSAEIVYSNDLFERELGLNRNLRHVPAEDDRGEIRGVYATYELVNGGKDFFYLTVAEANKYRARSKAKDSGPWKTDYEAMLKKTALKRLFNLMPMSPEVQTATMIDESETKITPVYEAAVQRGEVDITHLAQPVEAEFTEEELA